MNHAKTPSGNNSPLTDQQWAGLARMGDLGHWLGTLLDGAAAEPLTAAIDRIGALDGSNDLSTLAEKLAETFAALNEAGLLDLLRDNAQFVADSLGVLLPLVGQWIERLSQLPAEEIKADAAFALTLLRKTRLVADFVDEKLSGDLTGKATHLTEFLQRHSSDEALAEAVVQLGRLYRSGQLSRLGDLAESVAGLEEGVDLESLIGVLARAVPGDAIDRSVRLLHSAQAALLDARADEDRLGGYAGMLHLLRDKEVQKGLRILSVLPVYLERHLENPH